MEAHGISKNTSEPVSVVLREAKQAGYGAATQCIKKHRHGQTQEVHLLVRPNIRMGNKCDRCDFVRDGAV